MPIYAKTTNHFKSEIIEADFFWPQSQATYRQKLMIPRQTVAVIFLELYVRYILSCTGHIGP